jgi:hydroxymethylbilane synthase
LAPRAARCSARRKAQLAAARPDLTFGELRGNLETRVAKAVEFGAVVVALAALDRLGLTGAAAEVLDPGLMLPQVAQGALAVECREDDEATAKLLAGIDDHRARRTVEAERAYLRCLGGGCDLACGALATLDGDGHVYLDVLLALPDGSRIIRVRHHGEDPAETGVEAARRVLDDEGGRLLLEQSSR